MKNWKQNKNQIHIKNLFFVFILAFLISLSPIKSTQVYAWDACLGASYHRTLDTAYDVAKDIAIGTAKQTAAKTLEKVLMQLIGGSPMFISDWRSFMINQPRANANLYMNDYLSKTTSGRGSNFIFVGGNGFSRNQSYSSQLISSARAWTTEMTMPKVTYPGNPQQMFANGNFDNMITYYSGINNPMAFRINAQTEYNKRIEEEQKVATAKGVAGQGFLGTMKDGIIATPGIIVKDMVSNVKDIGNKIIAGANSVPEVITNIASSVISSTIADGLSPYIEEVRPYTGVAIEVIDYLGENAQRSDLNGSPATSTDNGQTLVPQAGNSGCDPTQQSCVATCPEGQSCFEQ